MFGFNVAVDGFSCLVPLPEPGLWTSLRRMFHPLDEFRDQALKLFRVARFPGRGAYLIPGRCAVVSASWQHKQCPTRDGG